MQGKHVYPKRLWTFLGVGLAATAFPGAIAHAGSARDYLNAPVDT